MYMLVVLLTIYTGDGVANIGGVKGFDSLAACERYEQNVLPQMEKNAAQNFGQEGVPASVDRTSRCGEADFISSKLAASNNWGPLLKDAYQKHGWTWKWQTQWKADPLDIGPGDMTPETVEGLLMKKLSFMPDERYDPVLMVHIRSVNRSTGAVFDDWVEFPPSWECEKVAKDINSRTDPWTEHMDGTPVHEDIELTVTATCRMPGSATI